MNENETERPDESEGRPPVGAETPGAQPARGHLFFLIGCGVLGAASAGFPPLSVFSILLLVIALASTSRLRDPRKKPLVVGLCVSLSLSVLGLGRFILGDALQGIIEARGRESSTRAVSLLREILFAQDAMRRYAFIDPDGDGVGSAGRLGELSGARGARGARPLSTPPLAPRYAPQTGTSTGPALAKDGLLYLICLPHALGGWTSRPTDPVDDEKAERNWVAFAWPDAPGGVQTGAYFIDQHERILQSENRTESGKLRLVGPEHAPSCDDVERHPEKWSPWRDKQPRTSLTGDNQPG